MKESEPSQRELSWAVIASLGISAAILSWELYKQRFDPPPPDYGPRVTELEQKLDDVATGACVNENVLRSALGYPGIDKEGCLAEWDQINEELKTPGVKDERVGTGN